MRQYSRNSSPCLRMRKQQDSRIAGKRIEGPAKNESYQLRFACNSPGGAGQGPFSSTQHDASHIVKQSKIGQQGMAEVPYFPASPTSGQQSPTGARNLRLLGFKVLVSGLFFAVSYRKGN